MERKHNKELVPVSRILRKNITKEERRLWYDFLRDYPVRFTRQKILGKYIVDFYCAKGKIVINSTDRNILWKKIGKRMKREQTFSKDTDCRLSEFQIVKLTAISGSFANI